MQSVYPVSPPVPASGGYEGVGEVYSLGSGVSNLSVGDWIIPSPPSFGTWQTYIVKEENVWHKLDKGVPMEYAASVTVNPLYAMHMLEDFDLSLRGFWLQKWMNSENAKACRTMVDYILRLVKSGSFKYEVELVPFDDFYIALDKALGKLGSHAKQVIKF
ncbi:hypothetical protein ZIOFF_053009 [Zingiber officinale]|uniref:Uncharacterized protein n=1 Tax=Zingiber officinale TaxID=94328 RepID=A0A8J5KLN5_ZINOF|nr:hypothetical protein ZIOFF_053009 [Zingiber officinale]